MFKYLFRFMSPWVCPNCGSVNLGGSKCWSCGFTIPR